MMVGPDYKDPELTIGKHWLGASSKKNAAIKNASPKTANWWKMFNDPTLTALIEEGYHNNINTQIAGVRVLQSRALLAQARGELFPQSQYISGEYLYERIGGSSLQNILPPSFHIASLGFSASWELDFWGKYRRAIRSQDASFLASLAAYDNALVTLTADIASTYINIRLYETLIHVTKTNIRLQRNSLKIARSRYEAGETSLIDVEQAKTGLERTIASLPGYANNLRQQKDKLAVLLGLAPHEVDKLLIRSKGIPHAPSQIEVGIPKETLAKRPDIHQARLEAVAQLEKIGATKANLFPALSLTGSFSFAGNSIGNSSIGDTFKWSNRLVNAGPLLAWPILNYGQITNQVRVEDALFQEKLLDYIEVVLEAQQEVQDSISSYVEAKKAKNALSKSNHSAMRTVKLALIRYKEGAANYTTVLDAEREQLNIQTSLTNAKNEISQAVVALYRSLGGGWQIREGHDVISKKVKEEMASRTNWGHLLVQKNPQKTKTKSEKLITIPEPNY
jgi:NodT family efflux transporter outer membrane factor (OMF) lipoprotein